jgi:DNA polymerase-3 subunit gamma/tau
VDDGEVTGLLGVVDRRLLTESAAAVLGRDCAAALALVRRVDEFGYNMRNFTQELIDYFRTLLLFRAVDNAAELVDLAAAEQADVAAQAAGADLGDLQRHLTILLKAESEMAASPFARLHLELALVKMSTMPPLVPVSTILERLKALEGAGGTPLVAGPEPTWRGTAPPRPADPAKRSQTPPATPAAEVKAQPAAAPTEAPATASTLPRPTAGEPTWPEFVALVRERKPMLAPLLEKGRPLAVGSGILQLGFGRGSFELSRLQDKESLAILQELAGSYFGPGVQVRLVPLSDNQQDAPLSLAEKKSLDAAKRSQELKKVAESHPLVKATLEIFGGTIDAVKEL